MNYIEQLEELLKRQNGTILTSDLNQTQIPRTYLAMMVTEGKLQRVSRGVYVLQNGIDDQMFAMQKKYPKLIFSHETALYLHGLTNRTPFEYSATVPSGYKVVETISEKFKIYYIKKNLYLLGVADTVTSFGNPIKVYNIERTVCDMFRSKNRMDIQIFNEALKRVVQISSIDYSLLMTYAKEFHVERALKNYMEVLL